MRLRFILSETGKGLSRNKMMAVAVVIVTFVSLLFVGVAALAQLQVGKMKDQWYDKIEVSVFMCANNDREKSCNRVEATQEEIEDVRQRLKSPELAPYIEEVFEETKEQAFESYKDLSSNNPWGEWVTADMLQFSFRVKLVNPELYSIIQEELAGTPGVSEVQDQKELVQPLFNVIDKAKMISIGIAGIMIVAAILLITTTIQLSAMSREEETQIMRLVGASNLFIQAPFMIEGAIAALLGAGLAVGTLFAGTRLLIDNWLADSFSTTGLIGAKEVWLVTPALLGAALLLALVSSAFSLAKYTKV